MPMQQMLHANKGNVIPFRPRPRLPTQAELEIYRQVTRNWLPDVRRLVFPDHYEIDLQFSED
jgi:hypothetical protein